MKRISSLASAGRLFSKHEENERMMIAICDELFTHTNIWVSSSLENKRRRCGYCIFFGNDSSDGSDEAIEKLEIRAKSKDVFDNRM